MSLWLMTVVLMTVLHAVKMVWSPIAVLFSYRYNSPMVLLSSVLFFMWVTTWDFLSKAVNWIGCSVLSIYLVHSSPLGWKYFFEFVDYVEKSTPSTFLYVIILSLTILVLYFSCILLDKVRIALCKPVNDYLVRCCSKIDNLIYGN